MEHPQRLVGSMGEGRTAAEEADRSQPIGVFLSGESFFHSAQHLHRALETQELHLRFHMPIYFLYCHSLELTMKAFLRTRGISEKCLRGHRFGHKLQVLWDACVENGLKTDPVTSAFIADAIKLLDPFATTFEFRYLKVGPKQIPVLDAVENATADLMAAVKPHCNVMLHK